MDIVSECIKHLPELLKLHHKKEYAKLADLSTQVSKLEHNADKMKNDIRHHLSKSLFIPIPRPDFLTILSMQDSIAGAAEDVGILLTLKEFEFPKFIFDDYHNFAQDNIQIFEKTNAIIYEVDELIASSFGGQEAEKVISMVNDVTFAEHQINLKQHKILKLLYQQAELLHFSEFFLLIQILEKIASISKLSEKLANRIRMTLENK